MKNVKEKVWKRKKNQTDKRKKKFCKQRNK